MRCGSICCTYQLKHSSNRSKTNMSHTRAYRSENGGLGKRSQKYGPKAETDKTERATGLGRRTKKVIWKSGIKLAALIFQTGGRQQSPTSLQRAVSPR